jgi:hypothetical protein
MRCRTHKSASWASVYTDAPFPLFRIIPKLCNPLVGVIPNPRMIANSVVRLSVVSLMVLILSAELSAAFRTFPCHGVTSANLNLLIYVEVL